MAISAARHRREYVPKLSVQLETASKLSGWPRRAADAADVQALLELEKRRLLAWKRAAEAHTCVHVHLRGLRRPKSDAILAHAAHTYLLFAALAILAVQHDRLSRAWLREGRLQQELAIQAARSEHERFRLARAIDEVEALTAQLVTCPAQRRGVCWKRRLRPLCLFQKDCQLLRSRC